MSPASVACPFASASGAPTIANNTTKLIDKSASQTAVASTLTDVEPVSSLLIVVAGFKASSDGSERVTYHDRATRAEGFVIDKGDVTETDNLAFLRLSIDSLTQPRATFR